MPLQAESKRVGVMNPKNYNFNKFWTRKIFMSSKRYESTEVDHWLYAHLYQHATIHIIYKNIIQVWRRLVFAYLS